MPKKVIQEVLSVPIGKLTPNDYNPNEMSEVVFESLIHGLKKDGFITPIIAQKNTNMIIDGEHRFEAAKKAGFSEVLVQYVDVDEYTAKKLTIALNERKGELNKEKLESIIEGIQGKISGLSHLDFGFTKGTFESLSKKLDKGPNDRKTPGEEEFFILVECEHEANQAELFDRFISQGLKCKLMT